MRLSFDYTNMLTGPRQAGGLDPKMLEQFLPAVKKAHADILADRENNILGFYDLPDQDTTRIKSYINSVKKDFDDLVVLGIGGSALGNKALYSALQTEKGLPRRIHVIDNVDPDLIAATLQKVNLDRTLFNVITKSGTTAETMSVFMIFAQMLRERFGEQGLKEHLVVTTDRQKGFLRKLINNEGYADFEVPDNVGGRFSVLTDVGLVSSAFAGIDIDRLLAGAAMMRQRCEEPDMWHNPAYLNGLLHYLFMKQGKNISVMMPYANALYDMADWYRQLWAESLGKRMDTKGNRVNVGQTPVKALGTTDQHSQVQLYAEGPDDKVFTFIGVQKFAQDYTIPAIYTDRDEVNYLCNKPISQLLNTELQATEIALTAANRPNCTLTLPEIDEYTLGQFIFMYQVQTVFTGKLLGIDPLDQPGVEAGKIATYAMMGKEGFSQQKKDTDAYLQDKKTQGRILRTC